MTLYVHVGMQKCGSKAIQHFCTYNQDALEKLGFCYPNKLSRGVWHRQLFENFQPRHAKRLERLSSEKENVVISFEGAYQADEKTIRSICESFEDVRILLFVRRPEAWCNSFANQILKAHRAKYRQFENFNVRSASIGSKFDFDSHLGNWKRNANIVKIDTIAYSKGRNIISLFLDWLGIPETDRKDLKELPSNPNKSLDVRSIKIILEIKKRLQNSTIDDQIDAITLAHLATKESWTDTQEVGGVKLISPDDEKWIEENYLPSIKKVLMDYGQPGEYSWISRETGGEYLTDFSLNPSDEEIVARYTE